METDIELNHKCIDTRDAITIIPNTSNLISLHFIRTSTVTFELEVQREFPLEVQTLIRIQPLIKIRPLVRIQQLKTAAGQIKNGLLDQNETQINREIHQRSHRHLRSCPTPVFILQSCLPYALQQQAFGKWKSAVPAFLETNSLDADGDRRLSSRCRPDYLL